MSADSTLCPDCRWIVAAWLRSTASDVDAGDTSDDDLLLSCGVDGFRAYRFAAVEPDVVIARAEDATGARS